MLDALFGAEVPLAVRFFIAFLIVLALIGGTAWIVRRFGANRFGSSSARGRQPRLAVIDAAPVDGRRRLVLIRRDNIEHLLIIGGPTDVVVEQNIVRAAAALREPAPSRAAPPPPPAPAADTLPRAVPLGESNWPLQPEPVTRPVRPMPLESAEQWQPEPPPPPPPRPPEPRPAPARRQPRGQDTLAGLAEELAARVGLRPDNTRQARHAEPAPPPPSQPHTPPPAPSPQAEQNLADMAVRLESALRRPAAAAPAQPAEPPPAPEPIPEPSPPPVEASAPAEEEIAEPEPAPAAKTQQAKSMYESLEQEMASLLARPPGKPDKPGKS